MLNSICKLRRRGVIVSRIAFIAMCSTTVLTVAESEVQVRFQLEESVSYGDHILSEHSAQLILRADRPKLFRSATDKGSVAVNGEKVTLNRGREATTVELKFNSGCGAGSVCRIQAGDATLKFVARPGQCYICTVLTSTVKPAQPSPVMPLEVTVVVQSPVPAVPVATGPAVVAPAISDETLAFVAELTANVEEDKRIYAEAQSLQNELNQADARKRNADTYRVEISQLIMKRDALVAVRDHFWILQAKTGGVIDVPDAAGGVILSQLQLANDGINARDLELKKLAPQITADNAKAADILGRLGQIAAGRLQLEQRRVVLKRHI